FHYVTGHFLSGFLYSKIRASNRLKYQIQPVGGFFCAKNGHSMSGGNGDLRSKMVSEVGQSRKEQSKTKEAAQKGDNQNANQGYALPAPN
ncbi:MAG: hypothetical protein Q8N36_02775, partial [bacterium]|nr:hypothetical protein [bacterium]